MKKIKIISFVVVLLMLFPLQILTACSKNADNTQGNANNTTQQDNSQSGASSETTTESKMLPNVPDNLDLNGFNFRILYELSQGGDWGVRGIDAEQETGDVINDATYARNAYVTDKYDFKIDGITCQVYNLPASTVKKTVQAGSDEYDAIIIREKELPSLIISNCLVNFNTVPGLNFDGPWWDKSIMNQMSIAGKQFAAFGDYIICANDALRIMMFNKKMLQDNGLEDPYALVKNGAWTLDKFYNMSKDAAADLNGDGKMDTNDRYGLLMQRGSSVCFSFGAGETLTSKDAGDLPVLTTGSERSILVFQKIWNVLGTPNLVIYDSAFPNTWADLQVAFENNQGLFFGEVLQLAERMRASETDFGILPFPKYDESQENYYAFGDSNCMNDIIIPSTNQNLEQTGQILEILSAESYYTLRPAYYDKSLNGKYVRDEESSAMLDIVLSNKLISLDDMFGWGMYSAIQNALTSKSSDFASVIDKYTNKVQTSIDKTVSIFQSLQ
ncbi:MAG: hypothetical protein FWD71_01220 [Oscillospiraceae bacterium]|nr:hypothetical protein [Oscillospiraceae bacterium]